MTSTQRVGFALMILTALTFIIYIVATAP